MLKTFIIWLIKNSKPGWKLKIQPINQLENKKRHGSEFIDDEKFMYNREDILIPIIMHYRVTNEKESNDITMSKETIFVQKKYCYNVLF